jgi:ubiquinone/menaquinone biosynthesis C-methylase UbiE
MPVLPEDDVAFPRPHDVAQYYDVWTSRYVEVFGDTIQAHRPTDLADLHGYLFERAGVRDGKRLLDAGCGVCGPSMSFARRADARIDALTVSAAQAEVATERIRAAGLADRITVTVGDYHRLPSLYPRDHFDLVFFLESLSHSPRPQEVLAGAYEVLKPGGIVYIKDFFIRPADSEPERERILRTIAKVDRLFATKTAHARDIRAALEHAGFLKLFVEAPRFAVDNSYWQAFDRRHGFDLFDGADSFDWSEWLELKYQKP